MEKLVWKVDDQQYTDDISSSVSTSNYVHTKFNKNESETIKLRQWIKKYHLQSDLQTLFLNMDLAMKYIHNQGYYIESFSLEDIDLLNNSVKKIKFNKLQKMPDDFSLQKELVHDNIFLSSVLHIGIYANCLQYFRRETFQFLKDNFDQFSIFLPEEDVAYYRGIIQRSASVYFSDFVTERKKRDLMKLEKEFSSNDSASGYGKTLIKRDGSYTTDNLISENIKENEQIYAELLRKDLAFVNAVIYPVLILLVGIVALILSYLV